MTVETLCDRARHSLTRFRADENGTTAIEYAIVAAGVAVAVVGVVNGVGSTLKSTFYDKIALLFP
ncbi:Flp family type IVb pilin [Rhodoplanes sp. Z2-YC6860]|uniref:Flp family type IVb pilin n=1 Tax=Rhodoplanes sp. Z2-YC6860 TaxID=674703 RepID=UPI0008358FC6|nr:Flp family type IVb pilin [Rhodoplanes sp. Z2-YC6860]